jgi:hypothetical protein
MAPWWILYSLRKGNEHRFIGGIGVLVWLNWYYPIILINQVHKCHWKSGEIPMIRVLFVDDEPGFL